MKCCDDCPGWSMFENNDGLWVVQRCDECAVFKTDEDAVFYVRAEAARLCKIVERTSGPEVTDGERTRLRKFLMQFTS